MPDWLVGKPLTRDVTAVSTLADSYVDSAASDAGLAPAEQAAIRTRNASEAVNVTTASDTRRLKVHIHSYVFSVARYH